MSFLSPTSINVLVSYYFGQVIIAAPCM